jgi:hypothetical protein
MWKCSYDSYDDSDSDSEFTSNYTDETISVRVITPKSIYTSGMDTSHRKFTSPRLPCSGMKSSPVANVAVSNSSYVQQLSKLSFSPSVPPLPFHLGIDNDFHSLFVNNSNDVTCFHSSVIYGEWVSFNCLGDVPRFVYDPGGIAATYLSESVIGC